ncbi:MAG TPA: M56 family metallopeptidase [Bryobacteraceae bacterium]|nr:M56 family metallopeptidase [Bryobacteraceae bacterium]
MLQQLLIDCSIKATFILAAASGVSFLLRRSSAARRHLVWTLALAASLLLPVLARITPVWIAPVRTSTVAPDHVAAALPPSAPVRPAENPGGWIPRIWLAGATLVLGRFLLGVGRVWLLTNRSAPMPLACFPDTRARLLDAGPGMMPMTWGWLRPVVLLPSEAAAWPPDRLRAVLAHELAHVDRRDWVTLTLAEVATAFYWFHPLVWVAAVRMRRERERACDDAVLAAGIAPSGYTAELLEVARTLAADSPLPAPAMARASSLESRLRAVLDPGLRRNPVSRRAAFLATCAALLALVPLASLRLLGQGAALSGGVYDFSGGAVPEAKITVVNNDTGFSQTIASGPDGAFSFNELAAGRYQVKVTRPGFAVYMRESVPIPSTLDVVLSLGQITESVVVSGKRSQATPPNPGPRRVRVGGSVQAAKMLDGPRPAYPPHAEQAGIQGRVLLQAVIRTDGTIGGLSVLSSRDPELTASAMDAVRQWRYQPTLLNGQPVEVITTISVSYSLDH